MKLAGRVGKLEEIAGKGRMNCPSCRLNFRINPPDPDAAKIPPELLARSRCDMCGSELEITLNNIPEADRDAHRLGYSYPLEAFYTDRRAHALTFWIGIRPDKRRKRERRRARERVQQNGRPAKPPALTPAQRRIVALRAEVKRWRERRHRELKEKHGDPFPEIYVRLKEIYDTRRGEVENLRGIPAGCVREVICLENDITGHLASLELEKIIWGDVRPGTVAAIEETRAKIAETIEAARVREREEAERRERERLEREERYRLEREQREEERRRRDEERERAEREKGRAAPAQSHPFWDSLPPDGEAPPRRRFRTEAADSARAADNSIGMMHIPSEEEAAEDTDSRGLQREELALPVGVAPSAPDPFAPREAKSQPPPDDGTALTGRGRAAHNIIGEDNDESHAIPRSG